RRGSPAPAATACPSRSARPRLGRRRDNRPATASPGPTAPRPPEPGLQAPSSSFGPVCAERLRRGGHGGARAETQKTSASGGCVRLFSALPRSTRWAGSTSWTPQGGRVTVLSSIYQSTARLLLSTLYEPLPKHLISVLAPRSISRSL